MKRIDVKKKAFFVRQGLARFEHRQSRRNKFYSGYRHVYVDRAVPPRKRDFFDIEVPAVLCLTRRYDETARFLKTIRTESMRSNIPIRLRLEDCQKITPPAMLLMLAEVNRARLLRGVHAVTGTYPRDTVLLRRMCHTGFFDLLQIKSPIKSERTFPMEYIKFKSGSKLKAESARELRNSLLGEAITMRVRARKQLQRGVTEAMLNALQHAYPEGKLRDAAVQDRWWLTGHYHKPTGNLSIMFCDLGVGIPHTLPRKHAMEYLRQLASLLPGVKADDGAMIYAGMRVGRSSTRKGNRGKGLNDLRQFIGQAGSGELRIFSRSGEYWYTATDGEGYRTNSYAVQGTLIVWTVPLKAVIDGLEDRNGKESDIENSNSVF